MTSSDGNKRGKYSCLFVWWFILDACERSGGVRSQKAHEIKAGRPFTECHKFKRPLRDYPPKILVLMTSLTVENIKYSWASLHAAIFWAESASMAGAAELNASTLQRLLHLILSNPYIQNDIKRRLLKLISWCRLMLNTSQYYPLFDRTSFRVT